MKSFKIDTAGYPVDADWYDGEATNEIILSLIGWTSDRKRYSDILSAIVNNTSMSAIVFEYSGHGNSHIDVMQTRPAQHFLEVICVYDWLKDNYPNAKIAVMGTSYGGYMATQLTKYRDFEKLILRVPAIYKPEDFYTLNGQINSNVGWTANNTFRKDVEALTRHPLLARASNFKGKTLVVVHENDEQVPKETTDAYINAFKPDVYIAKGFPHSMRDMPQAQVLEYQNAISDWLKK